MSSVSDFLIERLVSCNVKDIFGVPGDYILDFYSRLYDHPSIKIISSTDESHAGFSADAYARINGIGVVCVTYNVGSLKLINSIACAYAERSPLVVICGAPSEKDKNNMKFLSSQKEIFEKITCYSTILDNPVNAGYEIDKAFEALRHHKQPIYIELPRDVANKSIKYDVYNFGTPNSPISNNDNLDEAVEEVANWLNNCEKPAILAGVEIARYDLGKSLIKFAERLRIPVITTLLSKSVVDETHELFAGIYQGSASIDKTKNIIENSDCLMMFGAMVSDLSLICKPCNFNKKQIISCNVNGLQIKSHNYKDVNFYDFCQTLFKKNLKQHLLPRELFAQNFAIQKFVPNQNKITIDRFKEKLDTILNQDMAIIADVGQSLFLASDLIIHKSNHFLSPAFYLSKGFAIPGAIGVQIANPNIRPIVLIGDGAFQLSIAELSTIIENKLNPIIFVLNNNVCSTQRMIKEGPFNNLRNWNYHNIESLFNGGKGYKVETEMDLENAIKESLQNKEVSVINLVVDKFDNSEGMRRMIKALS